MGLKDLFSNISGKVRNAGRWLADKAKAGIGFVGRLAKPVLNVVSKGLDYSRYLPGKFGVIAGLAKPVFDKINGFIDRLPNGKAKEKLREFSDKGKDAYDKGRQMGEDIIIKFNDNVQKYKPAVDYVNSIIK